MKTIVAWLKNVVRDPLFFRVCLVFWGGPFLAFGLVIAAATQVPPAGVTDWLLLAFGTAVASYGAFLVFAGAFGSSALVDRAAGFVSEGGELLGVLLVAVVAPVALPVTVLLRAWVRRKRK